MIRPLLVLFCLCVPVGVLAEQLAKGPLAGLPSKPGSHVEKIRVLGDNSWLNLGAPAPDPKWGKARGRSWSCKMPLAAELRGAFLYGEGVHGYTKPDGYYMDDLWFYDLNAHRWVCCYPGTNTRAADLTVNAEGFETNKEGQIVAVAAMGHAYEMVTYDPDRQRFLSMPCDAGYWATALKGRKESLKDRPKAETKVSPWTYDVTAGQWDRKLTATASPRSSFGDVLVYVPTKKQTFFWGRDSGVWFYDAATNKWAQPATNGPKPPFGIDPTACYDSKRDRIYLGGGGYPVVPKGKNALWAYDLKTDSWVDPEPKGAPCRGSNHYGTQSAAMAYDSASDNVVLFYHGEKKEARGVYIYSPATNAWTDEPVSEFKAVGQCVNACYDPRTNAHFLHAAGDSRDDGVVWVYRYTK
jgi:hypothetical protein